jgi:hypothetical protein
LLCGQQTAMHKAVKSHIYQKLFRIACHSIPHQRNYYTGYD